MGGCSTPISALAEVRAQQVYFRGSIISIDGKEKYEIERWIDLRESEHTGKIAADEILLNGGKQIIESIRNVHK